MNVQIFEQDQIVRSNTRDVHPSVTPSAALQLKHRLCPREGIKQCRDRIVREKRGEE